MVQGTVDKIWHNRREDGSEYWVLTIDGKRYSTFDPEHVSYIQEGDSVEFSFYQSGNFLKLNAIKKLSSTHPISNPAKAIASESIRTVRMNCLRTAAELIKDVKVTADSKTGLVIEIARKLEEHVLLPVIDYSPDGSKEAGK